MKTTHILAAAALALPTARLEAATIIFQEGVSPSVGYTTGGVTIRSDQAGTNQNSSPQIIVGPNSPTGRLRGLFEFDLSAITTAAGGNPFTIDSVMLTLRIAAAGNNVPGGNATFNLHLLGTNSDFAESTVTWSNAPSEAGGTLGTVLSTKAFAPDTATGFQSFGDSAAFRSAVTSALGGGGTIRLIADSPATGVSAFARFDSDEVVTTANRPALTVNFTIIPEPGSALLVLVGGAGLLGLRRRQG